LSVGERPVLDIDCIGVAKAEWDAACFAKMVKLKQEPRCLHI
jgi:hypothetical protein